MQGESSSVDLTALLDATQWRLLRSDRPSGMEVALPDGGCRVGIVVFDGALPYSPSRFVDLAAETQMEWIAIMPPNAVQDSVVAGALTSSFFDYLTLPIDQARLLFCLGHAHGKAILRRTVQSSIAIPAGQHGMIGNSSLMLKLYAKIDRVMRTRAPVLITGPSGAGKELVALAVHRGSARHRGPFIPVNCGAIPESLIGSLLFGHEKGSFTGAHEKQIGSIEAADGGTILLDEIGDLPLVAQASLLRFLQESTVVRIGSTRTLRMDVRIIAATHVDLRAAVREGRFREDLFYRLNVLQLEVPPLCERGGDVIGLAQHFFTRHRAALATSVRGFAADALKALRGHGWPGNVRELFNRVQRAMVMCEGSLITARDLQLEAGTGGSNLVSLASARSGIERGIVEAALLRNGYNIAATARELSVSRVTLYRLLRRLGLVLKRQAKDVGSVVVHMGAVCRESYDV